MSMKMSEFIQKHKYNIQIAVEVTCLLGIFIYVHKKNKTLTQDIYNIHNRLLAVEQLLQAKPIQQASVPVWVTTTNQNPPRRPKRAPSPPPEVRFEEVIDEDEDEDEDDLDAEIKTELDNMKLLK